MGAQKYGPFRLDELPFPGRLQRMPQLDRQDSVQAAAAFQRAAALFQRNEPEHAEALCADILREGEHADTLHLLGIILMRRGDPARASEFIGRSIAADPRQWGAHFNLGLALRDLNRLEDALSSFERVLAINPDFADALHCRGHALQELGRLDEAVAAYDRALRIRPDSTESLKNRGCALLELGRADEALESLELALVSDPGNPDTLNDRGNALIALHRNEEALQCFDRALAIRPDFELALQNRANALLRLQRVEEALDSIDHALRIGPQSATSQTRRGDALLELGQTEEALASYEQALCFDPNFFDPLIQRGNTLRDLGRIEEAIRSYDRALTLRPHNADAVTVRANALLELRRIDDALRDYDRALRIKPDFVPALFNRGLALHEAARYKEAAGSFARVIALDPQFEDAPGKLHHMKLLVGDWSDWDADVERIAAMVRAGRRPGDPFDLLGVLESPAAELHCARAAVAARFPRAKNPLPVRAPKARDRIRVAYLSADFGEHAVSHVAAGLFERHDRDRFDFLAISLRTDANPGPMRQRLQRAFGHIHDASNRSDREAAALLQDLEVDIAVDLNGHTSGGRPGIFALRPAPLQVTFLGFPGTFGADYFDYVMADPTVVPAGEDASYAERVVRLPHSYLPYDNRLEIAPDTPSRTQAGLPEDAFVFCAFNNSYKITPAVFDVWMRLLKRLPDSVLWLRATNPDMVKNLGDEAASRGVAPERLIFAAKVDVMARHFARHRLADLFLDTLPYNAHSTAGDALWSGLPVLTCLGKTFAGRVAASLLRSVGLPELVAQNLAEYEERAIELATSTSRLGELRARLAANRDTHPLFDTDLFRRHLESAFLEMWQRHLRNEPPQAFDVRAIHRPGEILGEKGGRQAMIWY